MGIEKVIIKLIWIGKTVRIANTKLREKNKVGGLTLPDIETCYKITAIKTVN